MNSKRSMALRWRHQFFAVFTANLIATIQGITAQCLSPYLPLLQSEDSPLTSGPVTTDQASWIGSIFSIGGLLGTFLYNYLIVKFGKKIGLMLLAVPVTGYWLCVIFGNSVNFLYVARFLTGMTGGGMMFIMPLFVADVSEKEIRGILGSMLAMFNNVGCLLGYILGNYLSYETTSWLMLPCPIIYVICLLFLPETPADLLAKNRVEKAENALMFYRGIETEANKDQDFRLEFENAQKLVKKYNEGEKASNHFSFSEFADKNARKGLFIGMFLMFLSQFSGFFAILQYTSTIFTESGSSLSPNESSIIVGTLQIVGTFTSFFIVDRYGRKILLITSTFGTSLGLMCLATYSYLSHVGYNLEEFEWIPLVSIAFTIFIVNIGLVGLPFVIVSEVIPKQLLGIGNVFCMTTYNLVCFAVLKAVPLMLESIELFGTMWFFSGTCLIGTVAMLLFLPETKGKDLLTDFNVDNCNKKNKIVT